MTVLYIASKIKHAAKWRELRAQGHKVVCTWIDEAGPGASASLADLWRRCIDEVKACDVLIFYCEQGENLQGAFVELGAALVLGKTCYWVGPELCSVCLHPDVLPVMSVKDVLEIVEP